VSFDIFKETSNRSNCPDDVADVRPEVSGVFFSKSLSCGTKGLARITASEDVNSVSKWLHWQGFKIRPHRCGIQLTLFHLGNQVRNGEGFDLHMSDDSMFNSGKVKSSFDSTISCA
jgi:hypothetical protein